MAGRVTAHALLTTVDNCGWWYRAPRALGVTLYLRYLGGMGSLAHRFSQCLDFGFVSGTQRPEHTSLTLLHARRNPQPHRLLCTASSLNIVNRRLAKGAAKRPKVQLCTHRGPSTLCDQARGDKHSSQKDEVQHTARLRPLPRPQTPLYPQRSVRTVPAVQ